MKLQPPLGSYPDNMYMQHNQDVRLRPLKDVENYQVPTSENHYSGALPPPPPKKLKKSHKSHIPDLTLEK